MIVLGLGCNIGDRLTNLRRALDKIKLIQNTKIINVSPVYQSDALLPENYPETWNKPFLNAAVGIESRLNQESLLDKIKAIEFEIGREKFYDKWSPRIIDIDILSWNNEYYHSNRLTIPHPEIINRPFVLWPLSDIIPNWKYHIPNNIFTDVCISELIKKFGSRFDGKTFLHTKQISNRIDTPQIFGILNITPDSFSDGGKFLSLSAAYKHAKKLFIDGADVIDVGAMSTKPGSKIISTKTEWMRLFPFINEWESFWKKYDFKPKLSIDTCNPDIIEKLIPYKIDYLNDVSGLTNKKIQELCLKNQINTIFMHNTGIPIKKIMLKKENNQDILDVVLQWGQQHLDYLINIGFNMDKLIFDVGIGFGKNSIQSLKLIKNIEIFHKIGVPIMVGHSCKSFMNDITSKLFIHRHIETAIFSNFLSSKNVSYLRVHNVDYTMRVFKLNELIKCNI